MAAPARKPDTLNAAEFLQTFRRGVLLQQIDEAINEVVEAIHNTGGNGEVALKLPFKLNKAGQIECAPVVSSKVPKMPLGTGIYYASEDGRLTRRDPQQMDIDDVIGRSRDTDIN